MNKQELIEKYKKLEGVWDAPGAETARQIFLQDLEQLDKPEKVKVSEEEAKFLETFDFNCESDVTTALYHVSRVGWGYYLKNNDGIELKDLSEGFRELENRKRLIKAILDGYEVEKEKRYLVKMKGVDSRTNYLYYGVGSKSWLFKTKLIDGLFRKSHTRKELEQDNFGWVFDCEGIEIEEVTD
jgi:hypothetical protein|nr:MAG TPA: Protein of unknown function (DUF1642) [Caudoviricetes sp.]